METPLLDRFLPADRRPDLEETRSSALPSAGGADVALRESGASICCLLKKYANENDEGPRPMAENWPLMLLESAARMDGGAVHFGPAK